MKHNEAHPENNAMDFQVVLLLGRIDGKLDRYAAHQEKMEIAMGSLADRVTSLEHDKARNKGVVLGLSAAGGLSGAGLMKVLTTMFGA